MQPQLLQVTIIMRICKASQAARERSPRGVLRRDTKLKPQFQSSIHILTRKILDTNSTIPPPQPFSSCCWRMWKKLTSQACKFFSPKLINSSCALWIPILTPILFQEFQLPLLLLCTWSISISLLNWCVQQVLASLHLLLLIWEGTEEAQTWCKLRQAMHDDQCCQKRERVRWRQKKTAQIWKTLWLFLGFLQT